MAKKKKTNRARSNQSAPRRLTTPHQTTPRRHPTPAQSIPDRLTRPNQSFPDRATTEHDYAHAPRFEEISTVSSYLFFQQPYPYNPDDLVGKKGIRIYTTMMRDEQVKAAMMAKQFAVMSSGSEIVAPERGEDEQDKNVQETEAGDAEVESADEKRVRFIGFNLNEMAGSFDNKLLEALTALQYGFAIAEKIFWQIKYGEFAGLIGLKDLKFRNPEGIDFKTDAFGNLLDDGILQAQRPLPKDKFFVYTYRKKFSNYYGDSDLRDCYRPFWTKDNFMKFMAIAMERYGEPTWIFTSSAPMKATNQTLLENFMRDLQTKSGLILPSTVTADPKHPAPRAGEAFIPVMQYLDSLITRAILVPALIGFSGESERGSLARSETEFDSFLAIIEYLRRDLAININEQVVKPLIDINYEVSDGKYPEFRFKAITQKQKERMIELFNQAMGTQTVTKTRDDEQKVREYIGFQPLPNDVPSVGTAEAAPPSMEEPGQEEEGEEPKESPFKRLSKGDSVHEHKFANRRSLTIFEERVDFAKAKEFFDRSQAIAQEELKSIFQELLDSALAWIREKGSTLTPASAASFQLAWNPKITDGINSFLVTGWRAGRDATTGELPSKITSQPAFADLHKFASGFAPRQAMEAFQSRAWLIKSVIDSDLQKDIRLELFEHIKGGRALTETIKNIREILEPWVGDPTKILPSGLAKGLPENILQAHRLENIVRTETTWAYNQGRLAVGDAAGDYVVGYQLSAILDDRTTEICRTADGLVLRKEDARTVKLTPPLHYQCRTIIVFVTTDDLPIKWSSNAKLDRVIRMMPAGFA